MYSLKGLIQQSPDKIKTWLLTIGGVVVIVATARGYVVDGAFVAAVGVAIERTLDMFYVAPINVANNQAHALTVFENIKLKAQAGLPQDSQVPDTPTSDTETIDESVPDAPLPMTPGSDSPM